MKFFRVYIELTNICGLKCSFCPTKDRANTTMSLEFFEHIVSQVKNYTNEIACHVVGDPFTLNNLSDYLDILKKHNLQALLTTSGYYTKKQSLDTIFHDATKQINFSLNAYNKNDTAISLQQYIKPIIDVCKAKETKAKEIFINLRVWNLDEELSEESFNRELFEILEEAFNIDLNINLANLKSKDSIRLNYKTLLHFDRYFEWPSMNNPIYGHGKCQGLSSHIAILADGTVVPCCLDSKADINLGNLQHQSLQEILKKEKTINMIDGFKKGICTQELCLKCRYKERFNETK